MRIINARWTAVLTTRPLIALAACCCVLAIAACGSSSTSSAAGSAGSRASTAGSSSMLAFSRCMRTNGVPSFPDIPKGGIHIGAGEGPTGPTLSVNGVSVDAPAFRTARQKCQQYLPHVNVGPAQAAQDLHRALTFAECMRSHGVPKFPDPKITTGPGGGQGVDLRGSGLNFGSPAFQAAAKACGGGPKGP